MCQICQILIQLCLLSVRIWTFRRLTNTLTLLITKCLARLISWYAFYRIETFSELQRVIPNLNQLKSIEDPTKKIFTITKSAFKNFVTVKKLWITHKNLLYFTLTRGLHFILLQLGPNTHPHHVFLIHRHGFHNNVSFVLSIRELRHNLGGNFLFLLRIRHYIYFEAGCRYTNKTEERTQLMNNQILQVSAVSSDSSRCRQKSSRGLESIFVLLLRSKSIAALPILEFIIFFSMNMKVSRFMTNFSKSAKWNNTTSNNANMRSFLL